MGSDTRTLTYGYGNEYGPNGIFGRSELQIATKDNKTTVTLEHRQLDQKHVWTAVLAADTEQAIWKALQKSDFPDTAQPQSIIADAITCDIRVMNLELFPKEVGILLPQTMLEALPGYAELLPVLNSIIFQVSNGSAGKNSLTQIVVSQIQPRQA
jgi:hypothetical protein